VTSEAVPSRRPRARWPGLVLVTVVVASVGGYVVGSTVRSPEDVLASAKPPDESLLTVAVRKGSIDSAESFTGKAEWRSTYDVEVPASDSGLRSVVTATPLSAGQGVYAGRVLVEVSDRPVIVLDGAVPMLRDLRMGDVGADVTRLQEGLRDAGYYASESDGVFGAGTLAALQDLYSAVGYAVPTRAAPQQGDKPPRAAPRSEYAAASELVFVPALPATLLGYPAGVGDAVPESVARLGVGGVVVRVNVPASWRAQLRPGAGTPAGVRIQVGRGKADVGVVEQVGASRLVEGTGEVVPLTIRSRSEGPEGIAAGGPVEMTLTDRAAPRGLLVPLSALYTAADDGDFVRVVRDGAPVRVAVRVKTTGDGTAVVEPREPRALVKGDEVVVGVDQRDG
jgi:peptidoglycan hydrolase-like protein with peptidoglycan-binding domain